MRLDPATCRRLVTAARSGTLGTNAPDGRPHLVPIVFAFDGDDVVFAVDGKPKSTTRLQRLVNLEADPRCSLLVDHYDDDWDRLWWVRIDGTAVIERDPAAVTRAAVLLAGRYPETAHRPTPGPAVRITPGSWTGWSAAAV